MLLSESNRKVRYIILDNVVKKQGYCLPVQDQVHIDTMKWKHLQKQKNYELFLKTLGNQKIADLNAVMPKVYTKNARLTFSDCVLWRSLADIFFLLSAAFLRGQSATRWPILPQARQPRSLGGSPSVSRLRAKKYSWQKKIPRTTDKQVIQHEHFPFGTVLMQWEKKNFIQKITPILDSEQLQVDIRMCTVLNMKGKRKQKKKYLKWKEEFSTSPRFDEFKRNVELRLVETVRFGNIPGSSCNREECSWTVSQTEAWRWWRFFWCTGSLKKEHKNINQWQFVSENFRSRLKCLECLLFRSKNFCTIAMQIENMYYIVKSAQNSRKVRYYIMILQYAGRETYVQVI